MSREKNLSLIIPIYDSSSYLKNLLKNLVLVDYSQYYEIILVNDFSKDNSLLICNSFKKKNPKINIKIITNKKNLGVGISRNKGIKAARGEYLLFIDSDDNINSKNLLKLIKYLIFNSKSEDIFFLNFEDTDGKIKNLFSNKKFSKKKNLLKNLEENQTINYCFQYVYNKNFLNKEKLYFEKIRYAEDFLFITKIFSIMRNYKKLNINLIKHTYNNKGLSSKVNIKNDSTYLHIIKYLENFEKKYYSKINFEVRKYIYTRKKNCLEQFLIRSIRYNFNDLYHNNKKLLKKSGNILIKNNFFKDHKLINLIENIKKIHSQINNFIKNLSLKDKIGIYGYGVMGRSIISFLKKKNFKNFIAFDDRVGGKLVNLNSINIYNFNNYSEKRLKKLKKIVVCAPHKKTQKKIFYNLLKKNYSKAKVLKIII